MGRLGGKVAEDDGTAMGRNGFLPSAQDNERRTERTRDRAMGNNLAKHQITASERNLRD